MSEMKKVIAGLAAVAIVLASRPLVKRRVVQKMRDHCTQMAGQCKEMIERRSETAGRESQDEEMRAGCEETAAQHRRAEPVVAG